MRRAAGGGGGAGTAFTLACPALAHAAAPDVQRQERRGAGGGKGHSTVLGGRGGGGGVQVGASRPASQHPGTPALRHPGALRGTPGHPGAPRGTPAPLLSAPPRPSECMQAHLGAHTCTCQPGVISSRTPIVQWIHLHARTCEAGRSGQVCLPRSVGASGRLSGPPMHADSPLPGGRCGCLGCWDGGTRALSPPGVIRDQGRGRGE